MFLTLLACIDTSTRPTPSPSGDTGTRLLEAHCGFADCEPIPIDGDPVATLGSSPAPFRGYGDPSVARDDAGDAWMTYSWLDVVTSGADVDLAVRTHLARRDGDRWTYVRAVNEVTPATHPITSAAGWTFHEVSTWTRRPDGTVEALWLDYFEGLGAADRSDFRFARSVAESPAELGDRVETVIRGSATPADFGGVDLSTQIPHLADCAVFTEPDLFTDGVDTFLAATCIALDGAVQDVGRTRLVLLREEGAGYGYVGTLLEGADARALGADTLEQADVSLASDGSWLLVVTPILKASDPMHQGCLGLTIADLGAARVARDDDGVPVVRARITGEGNLLGPGLCTYDRDLPGGITMVLSSYDLDGAVPDIAFGLYATHVAP